MGQEVAAESFINSLVVTIFMSIYKTITTYTLAALPVIAPVAIAILQDYNIQRIDEYRVSPDTISTGNFPSATEWEDTNGDGIFDKKTHYILAARRGVITIDKPFEESDRRLTDDLVARLK